MTKYLPAKTLAQIVVVLLGAELLLAMASMGSSLLQAELLSRIKADAPYTQAEADANDLREMAVGLLAAGLAIISGIAFLKYLGRLNHNAQAMGATDLSATPGWTIGYFFVPIMNLYRPYQILQEIWKASVPEPGEWKEREGWTLLGWWWGVRLLDVVANQAVFRLSMAADAQQPGYVDHLISITYLALAAETLDAILSLLSIFMVAGFQRRQEERYEKVGEPAAAQCASCGEPLASAFETTCPLCGAKVQPAEA